MGDDIADGNFIFGWALIILLKEVVSTYFSVNDYKIAIIIDNLPPRRSFKIVRWVLISLPYARLPNFSSMSASLFSLTLPLARGLRSSRIAQFLPKSRSCSESHRASL